MTTKSIERMKAELEFVKLHQKIRDKEIELEQLIQLRTKWFNNFVDNRVYELQLQITVEEQKATIPEVKVKFPPMPNFQTADELYSVEKLSKQSVGKINSSNNKKKEKKSKK